MTIIARSITALHMYIDSHSSRTTEIEPIDQSNCQELGDDLRAKQDEAKAVRADVMALVVLNMEKMGVLTGMCEKDEFEEFVDEVGVNGQGW